MTERIEILIAKYFSDYLTASETEELILWIESGSNKSIFNQYIALNFSIEKISAEKDDNSKIWQYIEQNYKTTKTKVSYTKYFAVASIALVLGVSAFMFLNKQNSTLNTPVIVNNDSPGTIGEEKAVLTLDDGTDVALQKGKQYTNNNVESDGERLLYKKTESKTIAYNYLTVPRSGQFVIELSDKTKVWLNSETKLKYPKEFVKGQDRKVELLYGEAYFDVSPSTNHNGSQFKVVTNKQEITVLGTQFNVKAYNDEDTMYTTLVEGSVNITNGKVEAKLTPGQQAVLTKKQSNMVVKNVNTYDHISWKDGVFSFEGKTLEEIMKVISRWYDVNIIFKDPKMKNIRFVGVFNKYQSLDKILNNIKETNFINAYDIKNKTIILK